MTDIRDIYSTRQTTKDIEGNNVITVRDSLLAECLLSIIMGITLLSCLVVLRSYIDIIDVSMYMQFVPLLMTVVHVLIRRTTIKSQFLIFILHVISDVLFFFAVTSIPVLQFGNSIANKVYLGAILIAFTLFSLFYRLKPAFTASDHEFIVFFQVAVEEEHVRAVGNGHRNALLTRNALGKAYHGGSIGDDQTVESKFAAKQFVMKIIVQ